MRRIDLIEGEVYAFSEYPPRTDPLSKQGAESVVYMSVDEDNDLLCVKVKVAKDGSYVLTNPETPEKRFPEARQLLGTWADYVKRHGKRLAQAEWDREANAAVLKVQQAVQARLRALLGDDDVSVNAPSANTVTDYSTQSVFVSLGDVFRLIQRDASPAVMDEIVGVQADLAALATMGRWRGEVRRAVRDGKVTADEIPDIPFTPDDTWRARFA